MKTRMPVLVGLLIIGLFSAAPAWAAATGTKTAASEKKEEPKVAGIAIPRQAGGFLGLEVADGKFKLGFYDEKKLPVPADVARGSARWDDKRKRGTDFTVLNPTGDGMSLVGITFVRPPYNYIVFVTLLNDAGAVLESYPVNMME